MCVGAAALRSPLPSVWVPVCGGLTVPKIGSGLPPVTWNISRGDMEPITPADSAGLLRAVWIAAGEKEKACYSSFSSSSAAFLRRLRLLFGVGAAPITLPNCGTFGGSYGLSVK